MAKKDIIIKDTHRGLCYEDGVLVHILNAGRYELPQLPFFQRLLPEAWRDTLRELARSANARIYIGFDKHMESVTNGGRKSVSS